MDAHAAPGRTAICAAATVSRADFEAFRHWIHRMAGIHLNDSKGALVAGRLAPRLRHCGLASFGDYLALLVKGADPAETQIAIDLITTNETHFFREEKHFHFLRERLRDATFARRGVRIWSAASSSGEEPYSIAMVLASALGDCPWSVLASDVSHRVVERARSGQYPLARGKSIPLEFLRTYCLKGTGPEAGTFLVGPEIRSRIEFARINLNEALPEIGEFDFIFLRNVMIYFNAATKQEVVRRISRRVRRGGFLFTGHAESLTGIDSDLAPVIPSIYRKP